MIVVDHQENRVNLTVYGEFSLADVREFEELVNYKIQFGGTVDLCFNLLQMADFTLDVAWEEIVFTRAHANDFRRIAVVTESQWIAWSAWISQIFVSADLRAFDRLEDAQAWLDEE
ncbi:MAG: STAS/SEC14 domain-containing protein [Betaproteobacteria bacterium]|nr:STAS/SEC14 domain-containing protein [Betaproteobacteria bacterium]